MYATPSATPTPPNYAQAPARTPSRRPASIGELAERALDNLWDDRKDLKFYLRQAEQYRKDGKAFAAHGDHENAFVSFARAATLVLDKLPMHRDYRTMLSDKHRHNLGLNGQDILDCLGQLKPILVERHERWMQAHPEEAEDSDRTPDARSQGLPPPGQRAPREVVDRQQQQALEDERAAWQRQREEFEQERAQSSASQYATARSVSSASTQAALSAARQAAGSRAPSTAPTPATVHRGGDLAFATSPPPQPQPAASRHEQHQEALRRQAEEIQRRKEEQKRQERARLVEAETAARVAREQQQAAAMISPQPTEPQAYQHPSSSTTPTPGVFVPPPPSQYPRTQPTTPQPAHSQYATPQQSQHSTPQPSAPSYPTFPTPHHQPSGSHHSGPHYPTLPGTRGPSPQPSRPSSPPNQYTGRQEPPPPMTMPLENPAYDDDTTDSESVHHGHTRRPSKLQKHRPGEKSPPSVGQGAAHIQYPQLMSQHQRGQGYAPSIMSTDEQAGAAPPAPTNNNLLFDGKQFERAPRPLYSSDLLPKPSAPVASSSSTSAYPYPAQPRAPKKEKEPPKPGQLKRVTVPRETLPRFLAIAKINTSLNRETCGLLLGKDRGHKYVVTTLLIPKQHATSDTCTMDDEELVLEFTEERSLITLGWIHTHPSQSCFMSSVDLHTHSAFQCMLPESFAIVCAPKYNPTFGIFRLTDPPGLKIILDCQAKEAFHPHPDKPIYTDADREHVYLKEAHLEIVDLR
ncbi:uncharacterized protein SCHCODRAFT_02628001 [Schizophyllum commune H4-8]|nr:uncharacterized protein SCHCODRAFT_02628001 [Schizophyllum commune H4-8]KAI5891053.1 hypothetical protein SCHCODRAFT_02628001 [Schizophyllum commune H4-8]